MAVGLRMPAVSANCVEEIGFERIGHAGLITLNRPSALNALNHRMILALADILEQSKCDDRIHHLVLRARGRAFCAGGDIISVYKARGDVAAQRRFFADEYRLNATLARFPKPVISLIDGLVMGGGVGIAHHGSHQVMTQNAAFAMPETGIGFFPDVGGSYILSRLPAGWGLYLGLTGLRLEHGDALALGLATHTIDAARLPDLCDALCEAQNPQHVLAAHHDPATPRLVRRHEAAIALHFEQPTLANILASLKRGGDEWSVDIENLLATRSPTSLCVTFRATRAGAGLTVEECLRMDYRIMSRMMERGDFYEGVRAALIDKDHQPRWQPRSLNDVEEPAVNEYFAPLPDRELSL